MRFLIVATLSIYLFLTVPLKLGMGDEAGQGKHTHDENQTVETPKSKNYFNGHTPAADFYTYFLPHSDGDEQFDFNNNSTSDLPKTLQIRQKKKVVDREGKEDDEYSIPLDPLLLSKGPLETRQFVAVDTLPRTGKRVESSFRFRVKRQEETDDWSEGFEKPSKRVNVSVVAVLKEVPANFNTTSVILYYAHQLSAVEKAGDSKAKLGSPCQQTTVLEPDYCERAAYPNKNKMVCNGVNDTHMPTLEPGTCICKFYRTSDGSHKWKQMKTARVRVNGTDVQACLVPKYGVCNHRIYIGYLDLLERPIYEVDLCQGHFQCDNTKFYDKLKNGNKTLDVIKHCKQDDFLRQFDESVQDEVLLCAKPNPRRFSNYDEFKFYCLSKKLRDAELADYTPIHSIDMKTQDVP